MMALEEFFLTAHDGQKIAAFAWTPSEKVKAVLQISHGMAEYALRYSGFAEYLNSHGVVVLANDHRGHYKTAGSHERIGFFAEEDGWDKVVEDMYTLTKEGKKRFSDLPFFLLGHSMGSFLTRTYIARHASELSGCIISGTGGDPGPMGAIGRMIARREVRKKGARTPSPLLNQLSFGSFNKPFAPNRTAFDWLSRDEKIVDAYIADEWCGDVFSAGFFVDLLSGLRYIHKKTTIDKIPKDLPVLFFSGAEDPVGASGKGVRQVYESYRRAGIRDVTLKLYPRGRHEMLNEINREEVYKDVLSWMEKHISL